VTNNVQSQGAVTVDIQFVVEAATGCSQSPGKRRRVNTVKANGYNVNELLVLLLLETWLFWLIGYTFH